MAYKIFLVVCALAIHSALCKPSEEFEISNPETSNRVKRTLGVDENVKKELEIKTKSGTSIKLTNSGSFNDGAGLTMLPALIDSIGNNRVKVINALQNRRHGGVHVGSGVSTGGQVGGAVDIGGQSGGQFGVEVGGQSGGQFDVEVGGQTGGQSGGQFEIDVGGGQVGGGVNGGGQIGGGINIGGQVGGQVGSGGQFGGGVNVGGQTGTVVGNGGQFGGGVVVGGPTGTVVGNGGQFGGGVVVGGQTGTVVGNGGQFGGGFVVGGQTGTVIGNGGQIGGGVIIGAQSVGHGVLIGGHHGISHVIGQGFGSHGSGHVGHGVHGSGHTGHGGHLTQKLQALTEKHMLHKKAHREFHQKVLQALHEKLQAKGKHCN